MRLYQLIAPLLLQVAVFVLRVSSQSDCSDDDLARDLEQYDEDLQYCHGLIDGGDNLSPPDEIASFSSEQMTSACSCLLSSATIAEVESTTSTTCTRDKGDVGTGTANAEESGSTGSESSASSASEDPGDNSGQSTDFGAGRPGRPVPSDLVTSGGIFLPSSSLLDGETPDTPTGATSLGGRPSGSSPSNGVGSDSQSPGGDNSLSDPIESASSVFIPGFPSFPTPSSDISISADSTAVISSNSLSTAPTNVDVSGIISNPVPTPDASADNPIDPSATGSGAVPRPPGTLVVPPEAANGSASNSSVGPTGDGSTASTSSVASLGSPTLSSSVPTGTFSGISVVGHRGSGSGPGSCYSPTTPVDDLQVSTLNHTNLDVPFIEELLFDEAGTEVQQVRILDNSTDSFLVDVSDSGRIAFADDDDVSMVLDDTGLHFSTPDCSLSLDIDIGSFFDQLGGLTNASCGTVTHPPEGIFSLQSGTDILRKRAVQTFYVTLNARDQCGQPLSSDVPLSLSVDSTPCSVRPGRPGSFVATCYFPSGDSNESQCEGAVQALMDYFDRGTLQGACPSLANIWTLLLNNLGETMTKEGLFEPFMGEDISPGETTEVSAALDSFLSLYNRVTDQFAKNTYGQTGIQDMIAAYDPQDLMNQACRPLHNTSPSSARNLVFTQEGTFPATDPRVLADVSSAPDYNMEFDVTARDPSQTSCCPNAGSCIFSRNGMYYPQPASIEGSDCLCGTMEPGSMPGNDTATQGGIAFRSGLCTEYHACNATNPCDAGSVCLTDSCCSFSICVNATECNSRPRGREDIGSNRVMNKLLSGEAGSEGMVSSGGNMFPGWAA